MAVSEEYDWPDEKIWKLRASLLDCLNQLEDGRLSEEEEQQKHEWIAWVAAPFRNVSKLANRPDAAFSFQTCCLAIGADPEEAREDFLLKHAPEKASFLRAVDEWRMRTAVRKVLAKRNELKGTP